MKALTVRQPWASWIMSAAKPVEFRPWTTDHRGPLLIHAAAKPWVPHVGWGGANRFWKVWSERVGQPIPDLSALPYGAILGTVVVADCQPIHFLAPHHRRWYLDGFGTNYLLLRHPAPFDRPVPHRGQLGLFEIPDSVWCGQ